MTTKEHVKNFQHVVAILDDAYPNWHNDIDLDTLNMGSTTKCILGQLFGDYNNSQSNEIKRKVGPQLTSYVASFQEEWKREIKKRLEKEAEPINFFVVKDKILVNNEFAARHNVEEAEFRCRDYKEAQTFLKEKNREYKYFVALRDKTVCLVTNYTRGKGEEVTNIQGYTPETWGWANMEFKHKWKGYDSLKEIIKEYGVGILD